MPSLAYLVLLKWHFPGFAAKVWCKAVRHGKAVGRSGIGRNIILLTAVFRLGVSEVDIVCNDFGTAALAAFLVRPVADLEPALHDGHAAFCEILAHKLRRGAPRNDINKVRLLFPVFGLEVPIHRD